MHKWVKRYKKYNINYKNVVRTIYKIYSRNLKREKEKWFINFRNNLKYFYLIKIYRGLTILMRSFNQLILKRKNISFYHLKRDKNTLNK